MHVCFLKFITGLPRTDQDHSCVSLGSGCLHPLPASAGQLRMFSARHAPFTDKNRQDTTTFKGEITLYLDCYLRTASVSTLLTDKSHSILCIGIKSWVLSPPSAPTHLPLTKIWERPAFKSEQVFVPKAAWNKPCHKMRHLLEAISSQRN